MYVCVRERESYKQVAEALYSPSRSDMSKPQQLVVTFAGGYIAGVLCAVASHPPDTVVSKLNANIGSSALKVAKSLGWRGNLRKVTIVKEI